MKLTDFSIVFVVLFVVSQVPKLLESEWVRQEKFTTVEYNRIFDQAAEDCLMGSVKEECADGSIRMDIKTAEKHFYEQIAFVFDATDEAAMEALYDGVKMVQFVNRNESPGVWNSYQKEEGISVEESNRLRAQMEDTILRARRKDAALFSLSFPFAPYQEWNQNFKPHAFYAMYEGREYGFHRQNRRYFFSGSMIRKTDED
ncbi:MAG: hypothetical protein PUB28_10020 [Roseburia sp.]|nr:hypothetical protein [Roseburia sp.]